MINLSLTTFLFGISDCLQWLSIVLTFVSFVPCQVKADCVNDSIKTLSHFKPQKSIYYNPLNFESFDIKIDDSERLPGYPLRFVSDFDGCTCDNLTCGCCSGIKLQFLNFDKKVCANASMVPEEFAIDFTVEVDGREVVKQTVTGKNPPPLCVPLYFLPIIDFCARLHSLSILNNKLNLCVDFETRIATQPIFILHFDCAWVGIDGISWVKPQAVDFFEPNPIFSTLNITRPSFLPATEIYDEVFFEPDTIEVLAENNSPNSTMGEIQIGTLKQ